MSGLLAGIYSAADSAKRKVKGLLSDPAGYVEQTLGLLSDNLKANNERNKRMVHYPETITQQDVSGLLGSAMNFAPIGITAWHGSPHKFDKFKNEAIGTGEGAQAYGYGLYLSESPEVAKSYVGGKSGAITEPLFGGKTIDQLPEETIYELDRMSNGTLTGVLDSIRQSPNPAEALKYYIDTPQKATEVAKRLLGMGVTARDTTNLYKTDIPNEQISRMLDWDKPLSQQSKEVQSAMAKFYGVGLDDFKEIMKLAPDKFDKSGKQLVNDLAGRLNVRNQSPVSGGAQASNYLKDAGIPGIRYLDGGSRSAGQGSSNFVVFDPEMIRILERNGQPTGLLPWQPGEWQGLLK